MVENLANLANEMISWLQMIAVPATGVTLAIGGFNHMFGGRNGFEKAKPWYVGSAVGLIIALGATSITTFLHLNCQFKSDKLLMNH